MSFNVRYASASDGINAWENANQSPDRRDLAISMISSKNPHLIGFQEPQDNQLTDLQNMLPAHYAVEYQGISGGQREYAAFAYDTNSLSLLDCGVFSLGNSPGGSYWNNLPTIPYYPYDYFDDMGLNFPRVALWGKFRWKPTGQELLFYTTHFDFNNTPQSKSASLIIDDTMSRNKQMPLSPLAIVVGDFNSSQNNDDWKLFTGSQTNNGISGDFKDTWQELNHSWNDSGTFHGFAGGTQPPEKRIDWILSRGGFTSESMEIITHNVTSTNIPSGDTHTLYVSDHYPVVATLRFPPAPSDYDRDGLPDTLELASTISSATDPDTDDDGLLDGEEDLNGNGIVEVGETNPNNGGDNYRPTDIRYYYMDGVLDYPATQLAANGLKLYWRFDGRYLYVAISDAGEGSDHFIFVATNPENGINMPWSKNGLVGEYAAFLADENDNNFAGWFDSSGSAITNPAARAATYFENGGRLEGVIDLSAIFGDGFTNSFYLAAAPWGGDDNGTLIEAAQVPAPIVLDGNMTGASEYVRIDPGDLDHDGISDYTDPDRDGDGLPDTWEELYNLNATSSIGNDGSDGDPDNDGGSNASELAAGSSPTDANDLLRITSATLTNGQLSVSWPSLHNKTYITEWKSNLNASNSPTWNPASTNSGTIFPISTNQTTIATTSNSFIRIRQLQ